MVATYKIVAGCLTEHCNELGNKTVYKYDTKESVYQYFSEKFEPLLTPQAKALYSVINVKRDIKIEHSLLTQITSPTQNKTNIKYFDTKVFYGTSCCHGEDPATGGQHAITEACKPYHGTKTIYQAMEIEDSYTDGEGEEVKSNKVALNFNKQDVNYMGYPKYYNYNLEMSVNLDVGKQRHKYTAPAHNVTEVYPPTYKPVAEHLYEVEEDGTQRLAEQYNFTYDQAGFLLKHSSKTMHPFGTYTEEYFEHDEFRNITSYLAPNNSYVKYAYLPVKGNMEYVGCTRYINKIAAEHYYYERVCHDLTFTMVTGMLYNYYQTMVLLQKNYDYNAFGNQIGETLAEDDNPFRFSGEYYNERCAD